MHSASAWIDLSSLVLGYTIGHKAYVSQPSSLEKTNKRVLKLSQLNSQKVLKSFVSMNEMGILMMGMR